MSQSQRVEKIIKDYYTKRLENKATSLVTELKSYIGSKEGLDSFEASVDFISVETLCYSYFIDVIKYKEYHLSPKDKNIDPYSPQWVESLHHDDKEKGKRLKFSKVAAFTAKWLLKYKPISIQLIDGILPQQVNPEEKRRASSINEDFALLHSLQLLEINDEKLNSNLLMDMVYHFRYRAFDERHFFILYENIVQSSK
jgi:hypothetical protein